MNKNNANEIEYARDLILSIEDEILRKRVENSLLWFINKAKSSKFFFYLLSVMGIVFGAVVPVINSFEIDNSIMRPLISIIAVLGSISIGICTLFNFKETWIRNRSSAESLKNECFDFVSKSGKYSGINDAKSKKRFIDNLNIILSDEGKKWSESHKDETEKEAENKKQ